MMTNDFNHPWLQPLWRRVALVAICAVWTGYELYNGEFVWAMIVGGLTAYAVWMFFIKWEQARPADAADPDAPPPDRPDEPDRTD